MRKRIDQISGSGWRGVVIGVVALVLGYVALPLFIWLSAFLFFYHFSIPAELPDEITDFGISLWNGNYEDAAWFMILSGISSVVMIFGIFLIGYGAVKVYQNSSDEE